MSEPEWVIILNLPEVIWTRDNHAGGERPEPREGGGQEQGEPQPLQRGPGEADHRGDPAAVGAKQVGVNGLLYRVFHQ